MCVSSSNVRNEQFFLRLSISSCRCGGDGVGVGGGGVGGGVGGSRIVRRRRGIEAATVEDDHERND